MIKIVTMVMKVNLNRWRGRLQLKKEILKDYLSNNKLDMDKLFNDYYGYVYIIVKNGVSFVLTDEDIEEIVSDVFIALWKNSETLLETVNIKAYLSGIAKNMIKNKYRKTKLHFSISEYEEKLIATSNLEKQVAENEQNIIIKNTLKTLKKEEYDAFIMFYYENKTTKEIAKKYHCHVGKVKVMLHRIRKKIKKNLEKGGYGYGKS